MGNLHLRFDEGRVGRIHIALSPTLPPEAVVHESTFKERGPAYPIPVLQAHSWGKTLQPQTGQPYLCKTPLYLAGFLLTPTGRISGVSVVVHDSAGKETK